MFATLAEDEVTEVHTEGHRLAQRLQAAWQINHHMGRVTHSRHSPRQRVNHKLMLTAVSA